MIYPRQQYFSRRIDTAGKGTTPLFMDGPGHVNVRDYGAVGDGTTDDTKAIQKALNEGGTVIIPPGTYRCTSDLIVPVGDGSLVSVTGINWDTCVLKFDGTGVTHGLYFNGNGTVQYCGGVEHLKIQGVNNAARGITFSYCNHPQVNRCLITGINGAGVKFDNTYLGLLSHTLLTGCGGTVEGCVEVDHSTTWMWEHSRISGAQASPLGGLLIDRTQTFTVVGGNIENCGIPIKITSKAEGTTPTVGGMIASIDLEKPGTDYIEMGYGWSGAASGAAQRILLYGVQGYPSGASSITYGVKLSNTEDIRFHNCSFGLAGSPTCHYWLEGSGCLGTIVGASRSSYGLSYPWVMLGGTQVASATPQADWNQSDPRTIATSLTLTNPGSTPTIALFSAQGGIPAFVTITNGVASNLTKLQLPGGNTSNVWVFVQPQDGNTTFKQSTGSQYMLKMLSGADTAGVSGKTYLFFFDGTFWNQVS